jgi:hypothetical protein
MIPGMGEAEATLRRLRLSFGYVKALCGRAQVPPPHFLVILL